MGYHGVHRLLLTRRPCDFVHKATPLKLQFGKILRSNRSIVHIVSDQYVAQLHIIILDSVINAFGNWRRREDFVLVAVREQVHQDMLHANVGGAG